MKIKLKSLAISLCLLGVVGLPAYADQDANAQSMNARAQSLEQQLAAMQKELRILKAQLKVAKKKSSSKVAAQPADTTNTAVSTENNPSSDTATAADPNSYVPEDLRVLGIGAQSLPLDVDVPGQSFVSSGPYIGIPLSYSGGNLIINSPNINEDVALLKIRKSIKDRMKILGRPDAEGHSHLLLSGIVEGQATYRKPGGGPNSSDIDVTSSELDGYVLGSSNWTSALFSLAYDNGAGTAAGTIASNNRTENSRVFVNKAFIVVGDFSKSPIYGTIGQMYVPFGTYSSNMVSSPMTKDLGRLKERALLLGYQQPGNRALYLAGYVFKGDTYVGSTSRISNGGINFGYRYAYNDDINGDFGGGVIANLADSQGMQNTGNSPAFGGFGGTNGSGNEQISHRVPALNLRGLFNIGDHISLLAEYIGALNSFSSLDLTMNTHGAKPSALDAEAAYTFNMFDRPSSLAAGYGRTKDALALGVPWQRYSISFNTSVWKDTLQSLELRHDIEYAASNFASGSGVAAVGQTGKSDNIVTAQFDIYF